MKIFQLDKISLNQIIILSEIITESTLLSKEFVEKKFLRRAPNFDETIEFLSILDLIKIKRNQITLKAKYKSSFKKFIDSKDQQILQQLFLDKLVRRDSCFSDYVNEYFSKFLLLNGNHGFKPNVSQRLKFSGLRNFLMELGFVYFDRDKKTYFISDNSFYYFSKLRNSIKLSQEEYLKTLGDNEVVGEAAEFRILQFEKDRLSQYPLLVNKIEHVAVIDVGVGYDIKSFSIEKKATSNPIPRYIEVKAVSPWDYKFFWTRNELEKAKNLKNNYYLYLLPVIGKNEFNIEGLEIISAPYTNVYENKDKWNGREESFSFSLAKN